ncbi:hypothetical protein [Kocuria turfanensis]|nr:hypothetical protein [Kocuria turfanensis]
MPALGSSAARRRRNAPATRQDSSAETTAGIAPALMRTLEPPLR